MKIFKELKKLGYKHYSATTIEELDDLPLNSAERISEQALVLRWFREKYGLYFSIQYFQYDEWCLQITTRKEDTVFNYKSIDGFKTYEEAELACLVKLTDIVKADDSNT